MPNGHSDFATKEKPLLDAFFKPVALVMEKFAEQHNLRLSKYYHQFPTWDFTFKHPKNGVGKIEVDKDSDTTLGVYACWWFDDYDSFTRHIKKSEKKTVQLNPSDLENLLASAFRLVLGWQFGTWDEKHTSETYRTGWKQFSKEQFQKENVELYPIPRI